MNYFTSILTKISPTELRDHVKIRNSPYIFVGVDAEAARTVYNIVLPSYTIVVASSEFGGGKPVAAELHSKNILVCFDATYNIIDPQSKIICKTRRLEGVFYELKMIEDRKAILLIHELGVIKLDAMGKELWSKTTDIIESVDVKEDGSIRVKLLDKSSDKLYDPITGREI